MTLRQLALKGVKLASVVTDPILARGKLGVRILIYHQVGAGSGMEMDVSEDTFANQVRWILDHGRVARIEEVALSETWSDDDVYVFTFDDGHVGLWDHAYPILLDAGVPFTLYISTEAIENGGHLHADSRMPLLDWSQIETMLESGLMTVGAHTHGHIDLSKTEIGSIEPDLALADQIIEAHTGVRPLHFAYPWGRWSDEADPLVRSRYASATVGSGKPNWGDLDPHRLTRIPVMASDSQFLFTHKMRRGFVLESRLRGWRDRTVAG